MDELMKERFAAIREVIKGRKNICKNMVELIPLINELNSITMDCELNIRQYGTKLLIIIKKICAELEKEKEDGDKTSQTILDAFNSLHHHVYVIMQQGYVCVCVCISILFYFYFLFF